MPAFFHVDRARLLAEGATIVYQRWDNVRPPGLQVHVNDLFPEGVTSHGEAYLLRNERTVPDVASSELEILYEYVRRALYASCPSRFQSVFAYTELAEAKAFRSEYGRPDDPIWELKTDRCFRANMNLITAKQKTVLVQSFLAHQYWEGAAGPAELGSARWEWLLVPPVRVLRRIE